MKRLKNKIPYLVILLYLALIFTFPPVYINYPKLVIIKIARFPLYLSNELFRNLSLMLRSKTLIEENKNLRNRLQLLDTKTVQLEELKEENRRLKKILSFKAQSPFDFIACPIIAKDSTSLSNTIIIGGGQKQGIKENTVVLSATGVVVGRVIESHSGFSRVLLATDPNSRIRAISSRSRCEGMLYGISGGLCRMMYLPLGADIKKGDFVITSGFSSRFPKGLMLGRVVDVGKASSGLSLYAIVKPGFDLFRLEEVMCIR